MFMSAPMSTLNVTSWSLINRRAVVLLFREDTEFNHSSLEFCSSLVSVSLFLVTLTYVFLHFVETLLLAKLFYFIFMATATEMASTNESLADTFFCPTCNFTSLLTGIIYFDLVSLWVHFRYLDLCLLKCFKDANSFGKYKLVVP